MERYDLIVIGAGPAGYSAALEGVRLGARVALLGAEDLGGTCLNRGCIPTKTLLESAKTLERIHRAAEFGVALDGKATLDRAAVLARKAEVTATLRGGLEMLLRGAKIDLIPGRGRLAGGGVVELADGQALTADNIILATGSREAALAIEGAQGLPGSTEALALKEIPERLCIIGGGVVGLEFASFYRAAGSRVQLLEALPRILPGEDAELTGLLAENLGRRGVEISTGSPVQRVEAGPAGHTVYYGQKGEEQRLETGMVLNAAGRAPETEGLGLEAAGVRRDAKGYVVVDAYLSTTAPGIYAAGDVCGPPLLAHTAFDEGVTAARNALSAERRPAGGRVVPRCAFTHPELAAAGLTAEQAAARGIPVITGSYPLAANGRALAAGAPEGMVKIIASADVGQVLGVHILGEGAAEIISAAVYAIEGEFTCDELAGYVLPHPTVSEVLKEAAERCRKNLGK